MQPHEPQHARPLCPSPTPGVYPNSCPSSQSTNHLILCHPLLLLPSIFPNIRVFSKESALRMRWPKYWSFSFNIKHQFFQWMNTQDWSPLGWTGWSPLGWTGWSPCSPKDSQESSPTPQFKSINSSVLSFLYSPTLTSIHDYWKKCWSLAYCGL